MKPRDIIPGWNYLEYLLLRATAALVNALPITWSTKIARFIGDIIFWLFTGRRKVASRNVDLAFKETKSKAEKKKIVREAFRNLATSLMEFFRIPSVMRNAEACIEIEGTEALDRAFAKGKGVIFVVSHLGAWEYLSFLFYLRDYPCSVVVRNTKNPYIFEWIQDLRKMIKQNPITRKNSIREVLLELKKKKLVAILIDQWAGPEGLIVDFFGTPTSTTSIPARLARKTGAALVPGYCVRKSPGFYKIIIRPEVEVETGAEDFERTITVQMNQQLEEQIRAYPEQWLWTHRRWKTVNPGYGRQD